MADFLGRNCLHACHGSRETYSCARDGSFHGGARSDLFFLQTKGVVVVHVARNGIQLLDKARVLQPDLIVLNIATTNMDAP